jgi:hypothetical protein
MEMTREFRNLKDDIHHFRKTHNRWIERMHRQEKEEELSLEEVQKRIIEQCIICRYYVLLEGQWQYDWGVCSNPLSPFDGMVRFEHDGCDHWEAGIEILKDVDDIEEIKKYFKKYMKD